MPTSGAAKDDAVYCIRAFGREYPQPHVDTAGASARLPSARRSSVSTAMVPINAAPAHASGTSHAPASAAPTVGPTPRSAASAAAAGHAARTAICGITPIATHASARAPIATRCDGAASPACSPCAWPVCASPPAPRG